MQKMEKIIDNTLEEIKEDVFLLDEDEEIDFREDENLYLDYIGDDFDNIDDVINGYFTF